VRRFLSWLLAPLNRWRARRRAASYTKRILVPFTRGGLDSEVLAAALRIARAEEATLVPAYLIMTPLEARLDARMETQAALAMPLLEAVEQATLRAGIPVDARIENGRTPIHALSRLWCVEHFDRIVVPAPNGRGPGFTLKDLTAILANAPSETLILRPDPTNGTPPARSTRGLRLRRATTSNAISADGIPGGRAASHDPSRPLAAAGHLS
jgi:nucleotide-binding universal stress UspA family protein